MSWEERMGAKAKARRNAEEKARFDAIVTERQAREPWRYDPNPPDDGVCRECNEWRHTGEEVWGYGWHSLCRDLNAPNWDDRWKCRLGHAHHDTEFWSAIAESISGHAEST